MYCEHLPRLKQVFYSQKFLILTHSNVSVPKRHDSHEVACDLCGKAVPPDRRPFQLGFFSMRLCCSVSPSPPCLPPPWSPVPCAHNTRPQGCQSLSGLHVTSLVCLCFCSYHSVRVAFFSPARDRAQCTCPQMSRLSRATLLSCKVHGPARWFPASGLLGFSGATSRDTRPLSRPRSCPCFCL